MSCDDFIATLDQNGCQPDRSYESPTLDFIENSSCESAIIMACKFLYGTDCYDVPCPDALCLDVTGQFFQCKLSECFIEMLNATGIDESFEDLCKSLDQVNTSLLGSDVSARREILKTLFIAIGVIAGCLLLDFTCYKLCKHQRRIAEEADRSANNENNTEEE